tara:strand:- start:1248 stop:2030 length:783 start_codon:yes stop_codon:yes gene_type:complete
MRIASWNCKLALDRKWGRLQSLAADLAIVQECASPDVLAAKGVPLDPSRCLWAAKSNAANAHKGLGVFAGPGVDIRVAPQWPEILERWSHQPHRLDLMLPVEVSGPRQLNVLAVWSFNNRDQRGKTRMPGPVLVAMEELKPWLLEQPSLVVGDFNNHGIWDKPKDENSFARHLTAFDQLGFRSAYHHLNGCAHGDEVAHTHLWRAGMSYHIDYAFGPSALLEGAVCRLEALDDWCGPGGVSDHAPLVLDLAPSGEQWIAG